METRRPIACTGDARRTRSATSSRIRSRTARPSSRRWSFMCLLLSFRHFIHWFASSLEITVKRVLLAAPWAAALTVVAIMSGSSGSAQQAPAGGGAAGGQAPQAPAGRGRGRGPVARDTLGSGPWDYGVGAARYHVTVLTKGLDRPWGIAFLPNGDMLVTERPGRLRVIRNGVLDPTPIGPLPDMLATGLGGLR